MGIIERGDISQQEMKERTEKEYINRVRATLKSTLNGGNVIKSINTRAVATARYGAGVINWTIEDLERIGKIWTPRLDLHPQLLFSRKSYSRKSAPLQNPFLAFTIHSAYHILLNLGLVSAN